jgi:hypothetical protein
MLLIALEIFVAWIACGLTMAIFLFSALQFAKLAEYCVDKLKARLSQP